MDVEKPSRTVLIGSYRGFRGFGETKIHELNPKAAEASRLLGEVHSGMLRIRSMIHEPEEAAEEPQLSESTCESCEGSEMECGKQAIAPQVLSGEYGQAKRPPSPLSVRYAATQAELCKKADMAARIEAEELTGVFSRMFRFLKKEKTMRICSQIMFFRLFLELGLEHLAETKLRIVSPFMSGTPDMNYLGAMCEKHSSVRAIRGVSDPFAPEEALFLHAEKVFVVASAAPDPRLLKHIFGAILYGVECIAILTPQELHHRDMTAWQRAIPTFSHGYDGKTVHVEQFTF